MQDIVRWEPVQKSTRISKIGKQGMEGAPTVRRKDIVQGLAHLGIRRGDCLLVHSSLSSLGYVEGGADCVIDALLEAIGPEGTLVLPTLTFNIVNANNPVFDVRSTPSVVGRITEVFRQRDGVVRSLHPTHSCAAAGPLADALTEGHEKDITPCGRRSPFARLIDKDGRIVFLGVDLSCNTTFHALEEMACVPWLFDRWEDLYTIGYDGRKIPVPSRRHSSGMSRDFQKMEPVLERASVLTRGKIGAAEVRVVDAQAMEKVVLGRLAQDPFLLLSQDVAARERSRYERWIAGKS